MLDKMSFESYLQGRFRRSMGDGSSVVFETTDDVALIHQYQLLKANPFINLCGAKMPVAAWEPDRLYMVARKGRHCLGGCHIALKEPESRELLPIEKQGIRVASVLRHLPVFSVRCAQISDMVAFPDGAQKIEEGLLHSALAELISAKVRFVFIVASAHDVRMYERFASQDGCITSVVKSEDAVELDANSEVKQRLLVIDLAPAYKNKITEKQHLNQDMRVIYEN